MRTTPPGRRQDDTDSRTLSKSELTSNWLPRYTGMPLDQFGHYILLTNFSDYVEAFARNFDCHIYGEGRPMQAATNRNGITIINFGIGSANAATIMDLLTAVTPKAVLFLGKCTSDDYLHPQVPALPSFKLHKFVSDKVAARGLEYRTGVVYTCNRRVWEHDKAFHAKLHDMTCIGIDMETATLFIVGHANQIARGALLLVSDVPITPDGVKMEEEDRKTTNEWAPIHLELGVEAITEIGSKGEQIRHFRY